MSIRQGFLIKNRGFKKSKWAPISKIMLKMKIELESK